MTTDLLVFKTLEKDAIKNGVLSRTAEVTFCFEFTNCKAKSYTYVCIIKEYLHVADGKTKEDPPVNVTVLI